jgi:hypothetical protein
VIGAGGARWVKRGRIWEPARHAQWAQTHAMAPTPHLVSPSVLRIYVGFCDAEMVSRVGWVDIDPDAPARVLDVAVVPVLDVGEPGAFDDNGVVPTAIVRDGGRLLLYYAGFQRAVKVPYTIFTGVAESRDGGGTFKRPGRVPVLDRTDDEAVWRTAAHVIRDGDRYRMWYAGGGAWASIAGKPVPRLDIRHVESADGLDWSGPASISLPVDDGTAVSLGRPWVLPPAAGGAGAYTLHYSIRGGSVPYRLAEATSPDGRTFTPVAGAPGISPGPEPWDAEMMYASAVFERGDRAYLFYNGNATGATGFGWAERVAA